MNIPTIDLGLTGSAEHCVEKRHLATTLGSGAVDVFGTPAMIALMEKAAMDALSSHLPSELTSVGIQLTVQHLAATPVGMTVHASSKVTAVEGKIVTFTVTAWDDVEEIGRGTHQRAIVQAGKFQERTNTKNDG